MQPTFPKMELAGLIIAIVALVISIMALPTALQMFFGRPRLWVDFQEMDSDIGKRVVCMIYNTSIQNRSLNKIGVKRDPAIISATYQIRESGTNRVMLDTARGYLIDIGGNLNQGAPRATLLEDAPVSFSCLLHKKADGEVIAMNLDTRQQIVLPPGRYRVDIAVRSGSTEFRGSREVTVGETPATTYWLSS
jgi:hypothetical protein